MAGRCGLVPTNLIAKVTDFPHLTLSTARPQRDQLHPVDVEARQNKSSPSGAGALLADRDDVADALQGPA